MPRTCVECGSEVPGSSLQGYCPKCLLKLAEGKTVPMLTGTEDISHQLPLTMGDYELLEVLGEGGMGIVFKAVQTKLNRTVALKMLRSGLLASKEELKRFHTEAKAVARLKHPNVVTIHEIGEHNGRLFFSMDCIQGRSLGEIVGRTPLEPKRAAHYTLLLAEAMHYAHSQGVLHRDLKPGNVLVDARDQPHITDFGLAKELSGDADMTQSGAVMGTPSYMSPEQAAGRKNAIGPAADIYSLGAILYDLLTGRPPFRADSPPETLRQVLEQEPAPLRLLNAKVPRSLETICLKCLAKDPARRYDSAELLAEDLGRFLRGEPIQARRAGRLERAYRWTKRYPALAALQLAALVMVGLLGYVARYSTVDARFSVEVTPRLAMGLAFELEQIAEVVTGVATHPELVNLLEANQSIPPEYQTNASNNPLLQKLEELLKNRPSPVPGNFLLLNAEGEVLANYTTNRSAKIISPKGDREYFRAASQMTNGFYVSKAYISESDFRIKVAVIAPIMHENKFFGALGRMVAYTELTSQTERTKLAVISEMDPSAATNHQYAVIWHPNLGEKEMVPISDDDPLKQKLDAVLKGPRHTVMSYKDPVDSGQWVAGLAKVPVPDSQSPHLILVYQVRDRVRQALVVGAFVFLPWLVALGIWVVRKRLPKGTA